MEHGGDLSLAIEEFGIAAGDWLDLSTGINPYAYPFKPPQMQSWQSLPQAGALDDLLNAARRAYGASEGTAIVAAPGTQMLIQLLPLIQSAKRVAIVGPTYSEHAMCWRNAGAELVSIADLDCPKDCDTVIAVNPNNPDGRSWSPDRMLACAQDMAERGGLLIVDEAFADIRPEISVVPHMADSKGLLVLRSFGKFFGLAGLRLGFAIGADALMERIVSTLGPWAVSGPAIAIGTQALSDRKWQEETRRRCKEMAARLDAMLIKAGFEIIGGTSLYRLATHPYAQEMHHSLAAQGIWVRRFTGHPNWLRFGLPGGGDGSARLAAALA